MHSKSPTLLISDDRMLAHDGGPGHPERPERLAAIRAELDGSPISGVEWAKPDPATREAIVRVHSEAHWNRIESVRGKSRRLDPDTATSPGSVDAALLSAGGAIQAVDAVLEGKARNSFALVRPPGHHAEAGRAMGFCLFNNVAIAAAHARTRPGVERVLIVDWDVHHGNGTQHIFESRRDVMVFNTHRFPFYPGTGAATETGVGEGEGFTANVPLPAGMGNGDYAKAFGELLEPIAEAYRPDFVLVSAGFDAHRADPIADMDVTEEGFAHLCGVVSGIADRFAGGKIALILEGGYDVDALARSVRACVEVLAGSTPPGAGKPSRMGDEAVRSAAEVQRRYWKL